MVCAQFSTGGGVLGDPMASNGSWLGDTKFQYYVANDNQLNPDSCPYAREWQGSAAWLRQALRRCCAVQCMTSCCNLPFHSASISCWRCPPPPLLTCSLELLPAKLWHVQLRDLWHWE